MAVLNNVCCPINAVCTRSQVLTAPERQADYNDASLHLPSPRVGVLLTARSGSLLMRPASRVEQILISNEQWLLTSWSSSMTVCMSWLRNAGGVMLRSSRAVAYRSACRSHGVCLASCAPTAETLRTASGASFASGVQDCAYSSYRARKQTGTVRNCRLRPGIHWLAMHAATQPCLKGLLQVDVARAGAGSG